MIIMTPEKMTKAQLAARIKVTEITRPNYVGITRKQLGALKKSELVSLYKKQENNISLKVKPNDGRVRLQSLKNKLDKNTERLVLRQLYTEQRNALIVELGMYAKKAYDKRREEQWPITYCNLNKPNVKAAYDALPWNKREDIKDHYSRVIGVLFDANPRNVLYCGRYIFNRVYLEKLLFELYKVKSKLAYL